MFTASFWDERYGAVGRLWSGNANPQLVAQAAELTPGTALDVGCGEGADAIWLAGRGWTVTAVDVSQVALDRGAQHARDQGGAALAARITWQQVDAFDWSPPPSAYDLVSAQFMYLPDRAQLDALFGRLAAGVRPSGHLLVVGHHPTDAFTGLRHSILQVTGFTGEDVAGLLDPAQWELVFVGAPTREQLGPDGTSVTVADAVCHARRRP